MESYKAYSYLRFSTPEQGKGDSLRRQIQLAEDYARRHGLDLDTELTFEDQGISAFYGRNAKVGKLGEFLGAVASGLVEKGSYLLVESLDRISREAVFDAQTLFMQIVGAGITIVTLADEKEYSRDKINNNPTELIVSIALMMRAHDESAMKSHRGKANWKNKRNNGKNKILTKICPSWLKLKDDRSEFVVIEERAAIVRRIFDMASKGCTHYQITKTLNEENVPVFAREGRKSNASYWHKSYIIKILKNPAVIGTFVPHSLEIVDGKKTRVPQSQINNYYPAVVDADIYQDVLAMSLDTSSLLRGKNADKAVNNIFAGLARCPICGRNMILSAKNKGSKVRYFICGASRNGGVCSQRGVRYDVVEISFLDECEKIILEILRKPVIEDDINSEIASYDAGFYMAMDRLKRLTDAIATSDGQSSTIMAEIIETEQKASNFKKERDALIARAGCTTGPIRMRRFEELLKKTKKEEGTTIDIPRVNALLRQLLSHVVLEYNQGQGILHWKHGEISMFDLHACQGRNSKSRKAKVDNNTSSLMTP